MVTSEEHYQAYVDLRTAVLTRHFAMRRYWRADLLSLQSELVDPGAATQGTREERLLARWNVKQSDRGENPLMYGSLLTAILAVESSFGNLEARHALRGYLSTLDSLCLYTDPGFEGCPVRWDAYTSEQWDESATGQPVRCRDFLPRGGGQHWPIVPEGALNVTRPWPNSTAEEIKERADFLNRYRRTEVSMDEITGLVASYGLMLDLVPDPEVKPEAARQLIRLGEYLASNGFHLVRPVGGFSARGASGLLPSFEAPYSALIERTTQAARLNSIEFPEALRRAGNWEALAGPFGWGGVLGGGAAALAAGVTSGFSIFLSAFLSAELALDLVSGVEIGRAWQISEHLDVFDVWDAKVKDGTPTFNTDARTEFVASFVLGKVPADKRWEHGMLASTIATGFAAGFGPFVAITALREESDRLHTRDLYQKWFTTRQEKESQPKVKLKDSGTAFAAAVAVALGNKNQEAELVARLERAYEALKVGPVDGETWHDLHVVDGFEKPFTPSNHNEHCALDYLAALALAWWIARDRERRGDPVTTARFPRIGDNLHDLPPAKVPTAVLDRLNDGRLTGWPLSALAAPDGTLFTADAPRKPQAPRLRAADFKTSLGQPDPAWSGQAPSGGELRVHTVTVREHDGLVDTQIDVLPGATLRFQAHGKVWAGVALTGENGPNGWDKTENSAAFPLHGTPQSHPFALVGKLGDYFFIGDGETLGTKVWGGPARRLYLRINDDAPGNGNGEFICQITVNGPQPTQPAVPPRGPVWVRGRNAEVYARSVGMGSPDFEHQHEQVTVFDGVSWVTSTSPGGVDWGYESGAAWVALGDRVAYCRRVGMSSAGFEQQQVQVTLFDGVSWVTTTSPVGVDWGYDIGVAWVALGDRVAYCRRVGTGGMGAAQQYLQATVFDGVSWVTTRSPGGMDWGYDSGVTWVALGDRLAYCRRVGLGGGGFEQQYAQVTVFDGVSWVTSTSPGGVDWGYESGAAWVAAGDRVAYCRRVGMSGGAQQHLQVTVFDGVSWVTSTSPGGVDWGYESGAAWVAAGDRVVYCRRVGMGDPAFAQQHLQVTAFDGGTWTTTTSPGGIDWGYLR